MFAKIFKFNPYHGEGGRFSTGDSAASVQSRIPAGVQFVSPNVAEGTDMHYASGALKSPEQKDAIASFEKVDAILGTQGAHMGALGAWSDGAENSVVQFTGNNLPLEKLQVSASMKGYLAEQKAVVAFKAGEGTAKMHTFTVEKMNDPKVLSDKLVALGIPFHTLIPAGSGFQVMAFSDGSSKKEGASLSSAVTRAAKAFQTKHDYMRGTGSFIGSWDTREEGRTEYQKVIDAYVAKNPEVGSKWQALVKTMVPRVMKFANVFKGVRYGNR